MKTTCGKLYFGTVKKRILYKRFYLQVLQVSFLWVTQQRGDPVVVPHATTAAVPPHGEDLPDHHHTPQCTVGKLQDLCVADFLQRRKTTVTSLYLRQVVSPLTC